MRIVHIITGLETGGAEMMLKKVISETADSFHHVVISLMTVGAVGRSLQGMGTPVIALGGKSGSFSFFLLIRLAKELRTLKPDMVQAWMYHANLAAWVVRLLAWARWPLYWSVRGSIGEAGTAKWTTQLITYICALLSKPVTCIIYNSHLARHQHEKIGYYHGKALVIPNGFDTERFRPDEGARQDFRRRHAIPDGSLVIGHIGRDRLMKDHANLLEAALKVVNQAPNTIFVLAGPGIPALAQSYKENAIIIRALGGKLRLLPEQDNVTELMAAIDIFVLSSAFGEGFPNVLGEALSCGTPCVATDVGDCALIVGDSGIIVPPRDSDRLAAAIMKLLDTPAADRKALGLVARARMQKNYSMARIGQMYTSCWQGKAEIPETAGAQGVSCAE